MPLSCRSKRSLERRVGPLTQLKRSHDLNKLYEAKREGFRTKLDHNEEKRLDLLASLGISPQFHSRYTQIDGLAKPELPSIYEIYDKLNEEIRPAVEADLERWRRGIIGDAS
jgi:hypothetical protein